MSTLQELLVKVGADTGDLESGMGKASSFVDENFGKITAAGMAAGGAMEAFARSQADSNAALERVAAATGVSSDALRESAFAMSDHTFAAKDAAAGMELLVQKGITTQDQFEKILPVTDALADATGKDLADAIDSADRLLKPFGQDLNDVGDNADQMTRIMTQTDIPLSTLERNLGRIPDELQALEFGLDDAAAGIEVFRDRGFSGQEAVREFRRAVAESEGDMDTLLDNLGLTADQWDEYLQKAAPVPGLTDQIADANNATMTPMEKLQANVENLMFKYGGLADAAGMLAMPLLALGPIMKVVTSAGGALLAIGKGLVIGFAAVGKAFLVLSKILLTNPWFLVAAAIIALVIVVVKNWDKIKKVISKAWEAIKKITASVWDFIKNLVKTAVDFLVRLFLNFTLPGLIIKHWDKIKAVTRNAWNNVLSFLKAVPGKIINFFKTLPQRVFSIFRQIPSKIRSAIPNPANLLINIGKAIIRGLINGIKNMMGSLKSTVGSIGGFIKNLKGPIREDRRLLVDEGDAIMIGLINGIEGSLPQLRKVLQNVTGEVQTGVSADITPRMTIPTPERATHVLEVTSDGSARADFIVQELRNSIHRRGGDVQTVLGRRRT